MSDSPALPGLLVALRFAAERHRDQRRKGADRAPYVNHLIEVAEILARVGGVTDVETLQAAVLHDVVEDTDTSPAEVETLFGPTVRAVVEEVTDDPALSREEQKRRQVEHAASLSHAARLVKLADKASNVLALSVSPPAGWSRERKLQYVQWATEVVDRMRGTSLPLEREFDEVAEAARLALGDA